MELPDRHYEILIGINESYEWGTSKTPSKSTLNVKKSRFLRFIFNSHLFITVRNRFSISHVITFVIYSVLNFSLWPRQMISKTIHKVARLKLKFNFSVLFDVLTNQNTREQQISSSNLISKWIQSSIHIWSIFFQQKSLFCVDFFKKQSHDKTSKIHQWHNLRPKIFSASLFVALSSRLVARNLNEAQTKVKIKQKSEDGMA